MRTERQHREAQAEAQAQQEQVSMQPNLTCTEGSDPMDHTATTPQESPPTSPEQTMGAHMDLETQTLLNYEDDI